MKLDVYRDPPVARTILWDDRAREQRPGEWLVLAAEGSNGGCPIAELVRDNGQRVIDICKVPDECPEGIPCAGRARAKPLPDECGELERGSGLLDADDLEGLTHAMLSHELVVNETQEF